MDVPLVGGFNEWKLGIFFGFQLSTISSLLRAALLGQLTCRRKKISAKVVENPVEKSPRLRRCDTDF